MTNIIYNIINSYEKEKEVICLIKFQLQKSQKNY